MDKCSKCESNNIIVLPNVSGTQCLACDHVVMLSGIPVGQDVEMCFRCRQISSEEDFRIVGDERMCILCVETGLEEPDREEESI